MYECWITGTNESTFKVLGSSVNLIVATQVLLRLLESIFPAMRSEVGLTSLPNIF